jgi:hypothetical protein
VGLFAMTARNVTDPDVWWHLKTGEWILQHQAVPHSDPFSYTRAGQPWITHEWLSEILIYSIYRLADWGGLIIFFAGVSCAAFFLLYLRCPGNALAAGVTTLLGALATTPVWGVRPQILSFLLASLWLFILDRSERNRHVLWWMLPITLLWVNLHAGFALGPAVLAVYLAGEFLERAFVASSPELNAHLRALALALLGVFLLIPANPDGSKMFRYPLATLRSETMQRNIAEWASPNFHKPDYWAFLLLLLLSFAALAWSHERIRLRDLLLLLTGTFAALTSVRMIPIFVLFAVPLLSRRLAAPERPELARNSTPQSHMALNTVILAAMAAFAFIHTARVIHRQPQVEATHFPARAAAYLAAHPLATPVFNSYDWGGYLIFKLHPAVPVFIDGRADLYGDGLMRQFLTAYYLQDAWQQPLVQWKVGSVIVPPDSALAEGLRHAPGWSQTYQDEQAVIFTRGSAPQTIVPRSASAFLRLEAARQATATQPPKVNATRPSVQEITASTSFGGV